MKSYSAASAHPPAKRRWTCFSVTVPVIVFLSLVGTVSVLLGLHNRFPTGYTTEENSLLVNTFANAVKTEGTETQKKGGHEKRINELVDRFKPTLPQADANNITGKSEHKDNNNHRGRGDSISQPKDATSHTKPGNLNSKGLPRSQGVSSDTPVSNSRDGGAARKKNIPKDSTGDAPQKSCQIEFGSYCLWSKEHKEVMKDSVVKRLKDQLFVARAHYPTIAKLKGQEKLTQEMKQNIQDHERMLNEAISDPDLPSL